MSSISTSTNSGWRSAPEGDKSDVGGSCAWVLTSHLLIMVSGAGNMRRSPYTALLIIVILSSFLNILALRKGHGWGDDFALYIAQAKSLVEGNMEKLHEQNTFAMAHSTYPIGPNLVPWGFPLLLSPIYAIFGLNLLAMKMVEIFFFALSLIIIFGMFVGKLDNTLTLLLVSFFAFNPFFFVLNDHIISDIPYLFFSLLSIFIIEKILIENKLSNFRAISFLLIGFLAFLSYSIRPTGFVLLFLLFIVQTVSVMRVHDRKVKEYIMSNKLFWLPYAAFALCELIIRLLLPSGIGSYFAYFSSIDLTLIKNNIIYYISLPSEFFGLYFPSIVYGSTLPFVILGIRRKFKTNYLYIAYSIGVLFSLILLPYVGGLRYILPIFPFFIYFFCVGLSSFYSQFNLPVIRFFFMLKPSYAFMLIIICLLSLSSVRIIYSNFNSEQTIDGPFTEKSLEMINFIAHHTDKDDIIVFFKPRVLRLLTERQSIMISDFSQIMKKHVDYLVIRKSLGSHDPIPPNYDQISPYSKEFSRLTEMFPIIFENVNFTILRLQDYAKSERMQEGGERRGLPPLLTFPHQGGRD